MGVIERQPDYRTTYLQLSSFKTWRSSTVASVRNDGVGTKVGVGGGDEVEVDEVESQRKTAKFKSHEFFAQSKKQSQSKASGAAFWPPEQSSNSSLIYYFEADRFNCIQTLSDNSYEAWYKIHAQRGSCLAVARPARKSSGTFSRPG